MERFYSLLDLVISPAAQAMQEKQQMGFPLITACRKPGGQLSLQTDTGLCKNTTHQLLTVSWPFIYERYFLF